MQLKCGPRMLDLSTPKIMGILNITPDSFFDGGQYYGPGGLELDPVLRRAEQLLAEGADLLDIGGESTRPGATPVSLQEECDRVLPVVEALAQRFDSVLSVDTSSPGLMTRAAALGAGLLNDVRALQREGALKAAAATGLPVCLMHMQGAPATMQQSPVYNDPVAEVMEFLHQRIAACLSAGIGREQLIVDPGIGFGKEDVHNLALLKHLQQFSELGPVLLGVSRKSMFGRLLDRPLPERLPASLAVAVIGLHKGVNILRVHDVAATKDALRLFDWTQ